MAQPFPHGPCVGRTWQQIRALSCGQDEDRNAGCGTQQRGQEQGTCGGDTRWAWGWVQDPQVPPHPGLLQGLNVSAPDDLAEARDAAHPGLGETEMGTACADSGAAAPGRGVGSSPCRTPGTASGGPGDQAAQWAGSGVPAGQMSGLRAGCPLCPVLTSPLPGPHGAQAWLGSGLSQDRWWGHWVGVGESEALPGACVAWWPRVLEFRVYFKGSGH